MPRFKTKPVKIEYVEAIHNKKDDTYIVSHLAKDGKSNGDVSTVEGKAFRERFVEMKRAPKNAVSA